MNLLIFTDSYPYGTSKEDPFIGRELPYLAEAIDKITIIPKKCSGVQNTIVEGVNVENSFAMYLNRKSNWFRVVKHALSLDLFFQELRSNPLLVFNIAKLLKLILFSARAKITQQWTEDWLEKHPISVGNTVLYSYWFTEITMGLGLVKENNPELRLLSRAHGYDVYEEQYFPYYWPLRRESLAKLDKLFLASDNARNYFRSRYPEFHELFETAHLGVNDPGFISNSSNKGVLRIVSCAHIVPLKRIGLLLKGIAFAANKRPEQKFEWVHFGDGKGRRALQHAAKSSFPKNATCYLPGHLPNQDIMRHYREKLVDIFVNLSTTEGGAPVSIQEAISCGIPIIATRVGGNLEVVSDRNGILLDPNPNPNQVAQALLEIVDNPGGTNKMRKESRLVWEESYNAEINFSTFAQRLKEIRGVN